MTLAHVQSQQGFELRWGTHVHAPSHWGAEFHQALSRSHLVSVHWMCTTNFVCSCFSEKWFCIPKQLCKKKTTTCCVLKLQGIQDWPSSGWVHQPESYPKNWRTWNAGPTGPLIFLSDVGLFASGVWQYVVYPVYQCISCISSNPLDFFGGWSYFTIFHIHHIPWNQRWFAGTFPKIFMDSSTQPVRFPSSPCSVRIRWPLQWYGMSISVSMSNMYIYINQPTAVLSMINHWTIIIIKIDITMIDH